MKHLTKIAITLILSLTFFACDETDTNIENDPESTSQEEFAIKTNEIFKDLTTIYYPKEDVKFVVYKDVNGYSTAKYELTGKTKKEIQMGTYVSEKKGDGTNCDGTFSCGTAINKCLKKGKSALISVGLCASYCVKCLD